MRPAPFAEPSGNSEAWRSLRTALRLARESVADVGLSLSSPDLAQRLRLRAPRRRLSE